MVRMGVPIPPPSQYPEKQPRSKATIPPPSPPTEQHIRSINFWLQDENLPKTIRTAIRSALLAASINSAIETLATGVRRKRCVEYEPNRPGEIEWPLTMRVSPLNLLQTAPRLASHSIPNLIPPLHLHPSLLNPVPLPGACPRRCPQTHRFDKGSRIHSRCIGSGSLCSGIECAALWRCVSRGFDCDVDSDPLAVLALQRRTHTAIETGPMDPIMVRQLVAIRNRKWSTPLGVLV